MLSLFGSFHSTIVLILLHVNFSLFQDVTLVKEGGSLGFSIIGGTDHSCVPFGGKEPGIFISHVRKIIIL